MSDDLFDGLILSVKPHRRHCYQCDTEVKWLAPDGRCGECTRYTPEEIVHGLFGDIYDEELDDEA